MLVSAACHPCYATLPPVLPESGVLLDIYGYCFRHEPSIDPARMQAFRMREYVRVGTPEEATEHRDSWVGYGMEVLDELGWTQPMPCQRPVFGRAGRILAANQREESLKTELVVRLYGDLDDGTAVVSANCHRDHFGETFGISTSTGEVAQRLRRVGMSEIALALIRTHGIDSTSWPAEVRRSMGWTEP